MFFGKADKAAAALVFLVLVAGCSSEKAASKANFARAIQAYYDKAPGVCAALPTGVVPFRGDKDEWKLFRPTKGDYADALAAAGLLSRTLLPSGPRQPQQYEFQLTSLGSKAMVKGVPTNMGPGDAFCTGKYRLKEVVGFTEPGEMMGTRVSHVTHTYALEGAEDWAKSAAVSIFPGFGDGLGKEHREDTMMVLRNDGWVDSRAK